MHTEIKATHLINGIMIFAVSPNKMDWREYHLSSVSHIKIFLSQNRYSLLKVRLEGVPSKEEGILILASQSLKT